MKAKVFSTEKVNVEFGPECASTEAGTCTVSNSSHMEVFNASHRPDWVRRGRCTSFLGLDAKPTVWPLDLSLPGASFREGPKLFCVSG